MKFWQRLVVLVTLGGAMPTTAQDTPAVMDGFPPSTPQCRSNAVDRPVLTLVVSPDLQFSQQAEAEQLYPSQTQHDGQGRAHLVVVGLAARGTSARSVIGPKTGQVYSSLII